MFSDNLRRILRLKLIHQAEFARQMGVSRQTVNKWCNGEMPSMARLSTIADALDCSVDDLLMEKKSPLEWELWGIFDTLDDDRKEMLLDYAKFLRSKS